jgi:hypothetical protein
MDRLQSLLVDRGRLLRVLDVDQGFRGSAFALLFAGGTTLVVANETDDSIVIADILELQSLAGVLCQRQFEELRSLLGAEPHLLTELKGDVQLAPSWSRVVGSWPVWAWHLTNNLGVCDGIQVEFADEQRERSTIQLVVAASQMSVRYLQ